MPIARKPPAMEFPVVVNSKPKTAAAGREKILTGKAEKPSAKKQAASVSGEVESKKTLVPQAPESKKTATNKRKRLSKAFPRPLDKKLKQSALVRDCFTFPEAEYAYLLSLKKRLLANGVAVKKSELLRVGLALLASQDDESMKDLLAKVPRIG